MMTVATPTFSPSEPLHGTPGALVFRSDVICPWSTVALIRLRRARDDLGLDDLPIIHLAHSLELRLKAPVPRRIVDAEVVLCAAAEPGFAWSPWFGPLDEFPVSTLLALEAVQAARIQSEAAAEQLDLALRKAFFAGSRCITMRHEVLSAARSCDLDIHSLERALDAGVARSAVLRQSQEGTCSGVVALPDGSEHCNPGVHLRWIGTELPQVVPRVVSDDPATAHDLVARAAGLPIEEGHHDNHD
jgi:predicted DsbA family dithiol-disulfide isomerase